LHGAPVRRPRFPDFNPRPPRGGRRYPRALSASLRGFQSTPPTRGATVAIVRIFAVLIHFNPRPPRGGRLNTALILPPDFVFQSTPPTRGATIALADALKMVEISIHAPHAGGDLVRNAGKQKRLRFQSTPPTRGATLSGAGVSARQKHFNPRPPRGGRRKDALKARGYR